MDISQLKSLGNKTNRVIEIEDLLKSLNALAAHSLNSDTSSLTINLNHSCKADQESKTPHDHVGDSFREFIQSLNPNKMNGTLIVGPIKQISVPHFSVRLTSRFQFIVFDAIKEALKQEQQHLHDEIKVKTGTL